MKIVLLTIDYVPYHIVFIKALITNYHAEVHSFSISKSFEYIPTDITGLVTYKMNQFTNTQVLKMIEEIAPQIMFVGGWAYSDFNWICAKIKKNTDIPIVSACDTQWKGGKQWLNILFSKVRQKRWFTHLFVSGVRQYVYARKLGFSDNHILLHNYSCDVGLFQGVKDKDKDNYPKQFVFVGRFVPEKGIQYLLTAWERIKDKKNWKLLLIGDGVLKEQFRSYKDISIKDFMSQEQMVEEFNQSGCFVLPSDYEPWAVVIHEAVTAGLPIICTNVCGAASHFVINNHNGIQVPPTSVISLQQAIEAMMHRSDDDLLAMSQNSRRLSTRITPDVSAAAFMSVLNIY